MTISETFDVTRQLAALEAQRADLVKANERLRALAHEVAHDVQAPLQALGGYAELLARHMGPRLDTKAQEYVVSMLRAVGSARRVVDDLLDECRDAPEPPRRELVDCTELAGECVRQLQPELDRRGAVVKVGSLPQVVASRTQLARVLQNLLTNAMIYTAPDTVPYVAVEGRARRGGWELSVTDNGIGIAPCDRARVFRRYERLAHREGASGTGIGLAVCQRIVELHGGRIWIEDPPHPGTRFVLFLPNAELA